MSQETILIVEDHPELREGLREMLSLEGYRVMAASNGRDALQQMGKISPDLILSDITMPEMDGYEFFQKVRARQDWVTIPFIFLTARNDPKDVRAAMDMGTEDYLTKPITRSELVKAIRIRLDRARQIRLVQLQQASDAVLTAMANAIEMRDHYTRGHIERVRGFALVIGRHIGLPEWSLEQLRFGAILHDIGKLFVRDFIFQKSDPLTPDEWEEIRRHPVTGAEMIRNILYVDKAAPIIRYHHERWDGSGYPDRLTGEEIPLGARIVTLADSFDAMTTNRPYSKGRDLEDAYQEIQNMSGRQFDPQVVEAFNAAWQSGEILAIARGEYNSAPDKPSLETAPHNKSTTGSLKTQPANP